MTTSIPPARDGWPSGVVGTGDEFSLSRFLTSTYTVKPSTSWPSSAQPSEAWAGTAEPSNASTAAPSVPNSGAQTAPTAMATQTVPVVRTVYVIMIKYVCGNCAGETVYVPSCGGRPCKEGERPTAWTPVRCGAGGVDCTGLETFRPETCGVPEEKPEYCRDAGSKHPVVEQRPCEGDGCRDGDVQYVPAEQDGAHPGGSDGSGGSQDGTGAGGEGANDGGPSAGSPDSDSDPGAGPSGPDDTGAGEGEEGENMPDDGQAGESPEDGLDDYDPEENAGSNEDDGTDASGRDDVYPYPKTASAHAIVTPRRSVVLLAIAVVMFGQAL